MEAQQTFLNHPAADLFPMLGEAELQALADDIKSNGLLERIIIHDGMILDGRNRYAACRLAEVEPLFQHPDPPVVSPVRYVQSKNLHRRHLSYEDRAFIAAAMIPMLADEARQRQGGHGRYGLSSIDDEPASKEVTGKSHKIAAKLMDVSPSAVERARRVKKNHPEMEESVRRQEISLSAAAEGRMEPQKHGGQQPKDISTERGKQRAEAHKRRLINGLSMLNGLCSGLQTLQLEMIAALCEPDELEMWASKTESNCRELRQFAAELRKCGKPSSGTNGKAQSRQFGDSSDSAAQSAASVVEEAN